jgi:hypothetical protein
MTSTMAKDFTQNGKTRVLGGVTVIDTPLIARAMDYARIHSEPFLFSHAVRSWLFAVRLGHCRPCLTIRKSSPSARCSMISGSPTASMKSILAAFPRLEMKRRFKDSVCRIVTAKPETTYDNFAADFGERFVPGYRRPSTVDFLTNAPFEE